MQIQKNENGPGPHKQCHTPCRDHVSHLMSFSTFEYLPNIILPL